jgi:hypothetical protein
MAWDIWADAMNARTRAAWPSFLIPARAAATARPGDSMDPNAKNRMDFISFIKLIAAITLVFPPRFAVKINSVTC